jgi:BON domain-containing protein
MGLMRALGRAGTLALAGAAAGYYLHRRGLLGGPAPALSPAPEPPSEPLFVPQPEAAPAGAEHEPVEGVLEEPEPEPAPASEDFDAVPDDAELVPGEVEPEPEAEEERPDVTAVVDDLLAIGREGAIAEAHVVSASEDARVAEAVRVALAEEPGLLSAPIDIEVERGRVRLYGELERSETIAAVERKTEGVEGVLAVQSLLHLPGDPPPEPA